MGNWKKTLDLKDDKMVIEWRPTVYLGPFTIDKLIWWMTFISLTLRIPCCSASLKESRFWFHFGFPGSHSFSFCSWSSGFWLTSSQKDVSMDKFGIPHHSQVLFSAMQQSCLPQCWFWHFCSWCCKYHRGIHSRVSLSKGLQFSWRFSR